MTTTLAILLTGTLLFTSNATAPTHAIAKSALPYQQSDDKALKQAWRQFAKAIIAGDTRMIKNQSTSCVLCDESEYIKSEIDTPFMSIDRFIDKIGPVIFDANTKSRLLDSKQLVFLYDNKQNKHLYRSSCISSLAEFSTATISKVLVKTVEESNRSGGMQKTFTFIKTKSGYKFCGYYTIP